MLKNSKFILKIKRFSIVDLFHCIGFILICDAIGYLSSLFQKESLIEWYPTLEHSIFTPPSFVFAIVWGILYGLLGISTFFAFKSARKNEKTNVLFIFFGQLCFNLLWSIFFFGMKVPFLAFIEILFLIVITIIMMKLYKKFSFASYCLLFPYLLWLIFASYLNLVIVLKN